ncbi:MAG: peptide chain release factor N(5)-glutamine methyltransferase [Terracidiphilus sp.]|nr:peptide chain release factor N(5)-glutamine methyltransferase [Terracidiphilus sp.]
MPLTGWMRKAEVRLAKGPHAERARRDAETLMLHLIQRDKAYLIAHPEQDLSAAGAVRYYALVDRRLAGEPIQYITGEQEFFGLPFSVNHHVLIPRPETEGLVERVLELAVAFEYPRIVDVGTGSGAIAVTLARKLPQAEITAIDISAEALDVANSNAARNGVASRIRFQQGDLLAPVKAGGVEIVVSNPPYVATADREAMAVEVREFEPMMALFAGADGLDVYQRLIPAAQEKLAQGGWLAMEIGCGQAEAIRGLLAAAGFAQIEFARDLQGIERVATAQRMGELDEAK